MKSKLLSQSTGVLLLLAAASGQGGQFSFTADFATPPNQANTPTNVWQYFYRIDMTNRTGVYERLPNYTTSIQGSGTEGWRGEGDGPPYIGKHTGTDTYFTYIGLGEGHIHPDNDRRGIGIGFRAPTDGAYEVSGAVRAAYEVSGCGSINWYLDKGSGSNVLASGSHLRGGTNHNFYFPRLNLAAGEFVFLIVDDDGHYWCDSAAVEFVVSPATRLPNLVIQTSLTVYGQVGHIYRVEYIDAIAAINTWTPLTNITLRGSSQFVLDPTPPPPQSRRYYRVVEVP